MFKEINNENWLLYAQHTYDNPTLEKEVEFYDDLKRFKYLKRLFRRYKITHEMKIRLVLNHIVVLSNVFGVEGAITLLLFKIDKEYWPILKAIFNYLDYLYPHEFIDMKADRNTEEMLTQL